MGFRSPALDVSALSPAEYEAYTTYLTDILRSGSPTSHVSGGTEDKVDKQVVRLYMVDKLKISGELFDQLATRVASFPASRLSIGEIFALLRLAAHAQATSSTDGKQLADDLVFVQIAPIQASRAATPGKPAYEPRRRISVRANPEPATAPLPERKGQNAVESNGPPAGLNIRRLPPDAAALTSSPTSLATPATAPVSSQGSSTNPFSAAMAQAAPAEPAQGRTPPPLPPKPTRSDSTSHEEMTPARDANPFRQRAQSNGSSTAEPRKSSLMSPPLPPRPANGDGTPVVKKTTFTPSTKAASSTSSSMISEPTTSAPAFKAKIGPSGYASYPTPSLIKEGLVAAEKAKQRGSNAAAVSPTSASVEVIRRSADVRLSLPAQSTGGSTASNDGETNRRRSGSLLGYKPLGSGSYNNLNPFEPLPSSSSFAKAPPPQLFVPKAPPAPPPRTKEVVKSAMPLPPPRRKPAAEMPSADRMVASTNRRRGDSVVSRRVTLGHSDTKRLFEEAAAANPADSSSDEGAEDASRPPRRADQPQRRASAAQSGVPRPASSTTSSNSVTALRDNLEKMATDVRDEIAWLKGGRGGRWGTVGSHAAGPNGEDLGKAEKQRLVGGDAFD